MCFCKMLWQPKTNLTTVFGTQFIYTWVKSQTYKLCPKLHLVSLRFLVFPCVFPSVSHSSVIPNPLPFTFFSLLQYFISGVIIIIFPLPHIFLCSLIRIPMDSYNFRGFSWNLFQTLNSVQGWIPNGTISPWLPISLGSPFTLTTFLSVSVQPTTQEPLKLSSPRPWSQPQGWARCDKAQC